jgi:F-type H+-transporting ATPase subunit b
MGLLQPEVGLLFWMTLAFAIVFIVLARFGFPVILKSVESRKAFISSSLTAAQEAKEKVARVETECQEMRKEAEAQRTEMLHQAAEHRNRLMEEARQEAGQERDRLIADARQRAESERKAILQEARGQVAMMAIALTERLLRSNLKDREQQTELAERILKEMEPQDA